MSRRSNRASLPHAKYGVDLADVPDYIEPFVAYRAWNWTSEGVTSLYHHAPWTPKVAFEAKCHQTERDQSMLAASSSPAAKAFWAKHQHQVPEPKCTCGMYAGINMAHLISINYIQRGIHGEVYLWGRLHKHTLGWRAQYAYPKYFVVPSIMIPVKLEEAKKRLDMLTEFDVDIYLQPEREAQVGQETIPLWVKDYGYSQQGLSWLVEKGKRFYEGPLKHTLKVGDRIAVFSDVNGGGIGIVTEIDGDEMSYTLFNANAIYHKNVKDVVWDERNSRWETTGLGSGHKI